MCGSIDTADAPHRVSNILDAIKNASLGNSSDLVVITRKIRHGSAILLQVVRISLLSRVPVECHDIHQIVAWVVLLVSYVPGILVRRIIRCVYIQQVVDALLFPQVSLSVIPETRGFS